MCTPAVPARGGCFPPPPRPSVASHHALLRILHQAAVRNFELGVLIVHRTEERESLVEESARTGVRVRDEACAVLHRDANRGEVRRVCVPRLDDGAVADFGWPVRVVAPSGGRAAVVCAEHGRPCSPLKYAHVKLHRLRACPNVVAVVADLHAKQVVRPVAKEHIAGLR